MCDAVVHLDIDLRILEPCPKLAHLLLYPTALSGTMPLQFKDLLSPNEQDRLTSYIGEEVNVEGANLEKNVLPARALHLHILDMNGLALPVEIFSSFISDVDDSCCSYHLVGICMEANPTSSRNTGVSPCVQGDGLPEAVSSTSAGKLRYLDGDRSEKLDPAMRPAACSDVPELGSCGAEPPGPSSSTRGGTDCGPQIVGKRNLEAEVAKQRANAHHGVTTRSQTSLPTTTGTGRLFDSIKHHIQEQEGAGQADAQFQFNLNLERIVHLDEQEHWLIDTAGSSIGGESARTYRSIPDSTRGSADV
jgi:hypothetical protein